MGAVRNSNTRASHASVEASGGAQHSAGAQDPKNAASNATKDIESPHLGPETPDRRPSFSYLRRASDRRRRRRMLGRGENPDAETGSPRHHREFSYPSRSGGQQGGAGRRESESGQESDLVQRHDSLTTAQHGLDRQQDLQGLRRSDPAYDEHGEHLASYVRPDNEDNGNDEFDARRQQHEHAGKQQVVAEQQRRQSINDRLTEAVSDVMDFVREESTRRGKRRSMIRRRGVGGPGTGHGSGFSAGSGSGGAGPPTDEADFDSEELGASGLVGQAPGGSGIGGDRSPNQRRRRVLRRSLRRTAQTRIHNDSDTGSGASLAHEQAPFMMGAQQPPHQQSHHQQMAQRYKLQQHGGSMQDGHPMYGKRGTALLIEQHRRHQSADLHHEQHQAELPMQQQIYYQSGIVELGFGAMPVEQTQPKAAEGGAPKIRPIMVGASPPPLVGSAEADLVAARRKRAEELGVAALRADDSGTIVDEDEETAIHVGSGPDVVEQTGSRKCSPSGRFIAPKVAPLNSPSAQLIPDEEIVPPNVPFRGRRLPQIPGSGMIKSAADFLHSSIYGGRHERASGHMGARSVLAAAPVATTSLMVGGQYGGDLISDEPEFPSVSESPTIKQVGGGVGQSGDLLPSTSGIVKKPLDALCAASFESSTSINFPRVSFSPTHGASASGSSQQQAGKYHHHLPGGGLPTAAASMIATQAVGGGPQSTVLAAPAQVAAASGEGAPMTAWAGRARRGPIRDDEDDWF